MKFFPFQVKREAKSIGGGDLQANPRIEMKDCT